MRQKLQLEQEQRFCSKMLEGKILKIARSLDDKWIVVLDGHNKIFDNFARVMKYLDLVARKAKDPKKIALLKEDTRHFMKWPEN